MHNSRKIQDFDLSFQVFDIRRLSSTQELYDSTIQEPENVLTSAAYDPWSRRLLTAGNQLTCWPVLVCCFLGISLITECRPTKNASSNIDTPED